MIYLGHVNDEKKRLLGTSGGLVRAIFEYALQCGFVDKVYMAKAPNDIVVVDKNNIKSMWVEGCAAIYKRFSLCPTMGDGAFLLPCDNTQCKLKISPLCGGVLQPAYIDNIDGVVAHRHGIWPGLHMLKKDGVGPITYQKSLTEDRCKKCKIVMANAHMVVADPWELLKKTEQPGWTLLNLKDEALSWLVEGADVTLIKLKDDVWNKHIEVFRKGHGR